MNKQVLAILASTLWISISEFFRNSILLHDQWISHYKSLGLQFPEANINGVIWGIWSLVFAAVIYVLSTKFDAKSTFGLAWVVGFLMMWLVIGNLGVLPMDILPWAIPLSILEVAVATWIVFSIKTKTS